MREPDYKDLYFTLFYETEQVIRKLIEVQRMCEDKVLDEEDPPEP